MADNIAAVSRGVMCGDCCNVSIDHCSLPLDVPVCDVPGVTHRHRGLPDNGDLCRRSTTIKVHLDTQTQVKHKQRVWHTELTRPQSVTRRPSSIFAAECCVCLMKSFVTLMFDVIMRILTVVTCCLIVLTYYWADSPALYFGFDFNDWLTIVHASELCLFICTLCCLA